MQERLIIFESVLAWDMVNQAFPSLSIAAIIDNLGETEWSVALPSPFLLAQVLRMKLVSLIQDSSIFIILFFYESSLIITKAYYWRRTKFLLELADGWSFLDFYSLALSHP